MTHEPTTQTPSTARGGLARSVGLFRDDLYGEPGRVLGERGLSLGRGRGVANRRTTFRLGGGAVRGDAGPRPLLRRRHPRRTDPFVLRREVEGVDRQELCQAPRVPG